MTHGVFSNLAFEYELAGHGVPDVALTLERRFETILRLVDGWRDAVVATRHDGDLDEVLCWGCSQRAHTIAGAAADSWPDVDVVRRVNDKRFGHHVERELGVELRGASIVTGVEELEVAAQRLGGRWILKHPFGVAGREQLRGHTLDGATRRRAEALFETSPGGVVFEPHVDVERELSFHFDITADATTLVGCAGLITGNRGVFRGNRAPIAPEVELEPDARAAAERVARAGYRGPLGIDAFVGSIAGRLVKRPIVELNARWTFGRLALELSGAVGAPVTWHHPARGNRPDGLEPMPAAAPPGSWLLPDWCDREGRSGTWIDVLATGRQN